VGSSFLERGKGGSHGFQEGYLTWERKLGGNKPKTPDGLFERGNSKETDNYTRGGKKTGSTLREEEEMETGVATGERPKEC